MQFFNDAISTRQLPHTLHLLQQHAPRVLKTKCFNPLNLSFRKEVVNTELGHLFEHILLSYLCEETIEAGASCALYDGVTYWNWERYPKGNFKIVIGQKLNKSILQRALVRSVRLTELLFTQRETEKVPTTLSAMQQPLRQPLGVQSAISA
jgi:hypothetical protein